MGGGIVSTLRSVREWCCSYGHKSIVACYSLKERGARTMAYVEHGLDETYLSLVCSLD
jgi:hypothetical protein